MKRFPFTPAICAVALFLTGCQNFLADETESPEVAEGETADMNSAVEEESQSEENAFAFLQFWNWFEKDEEAVSVEESEQTEQPLAFLQFWKWFEQDEEPRAEPPTDAAVIAQQQREPFTYVEAKREKEWADYLLPWKWFEQDQKVAAVPEFEKFRRVEAGAAEEKSAFDFLKFGKRRKDEAPKPITLSDVLSDMSPELVNRSERKEDAQIRTAKIIDIQTRSIWDDLNDIFFLDRPSRLSMSPSP